MANEEQMIEDYLEAVLAAIRNRALAYYSAAGSSPAEKLVRVTEIKNAYKAVSVPERFSIRALEYSRCPSGVCVGGVCVEGVEFRDDELDTLVQQLQLTPEAFNR